MELEELSPRQASETLAERLKVCQTCVHFSVLEAADQTDALTDQERALREKKCEFLKNGHCKIADFAVPNIFPSLQDFGISEARAEG